MMNEKAADLAESFRQEVYKELRYQAGQHFIGLVKTIKTALDCDLATAKFLADCLWFYMNTPDLQADLRHFASILKSKAGNPQ